MNNWSKELYTTSCRKTGIFGSYGNHHHFDNVKFGAIAYTLANQPASGGWSDHTYEVRAKADAATEQSPLVVFRWQDGDNHYFFYPTASTLRLYRMVGGAVTLLQEGVVSGLLDGNWHSYKVELSGSSLGVYADGALVVSVTGVTQ